MIFDLFGDGNKDREKQRTQGKHREFCLARSVTTLVAERTHIYNWPGNTI